MTTSETLKDKVKGRYNELDIHDEFAADEHPLYSNGKSVFAHQTFKNLQSGHYYLLWVKTGFEFI